ncbi:energy-converting hydrogenase Eha subunit G [Agrobacterium vitis]|nr:energy-converting hydrogenase Eha subunit G [Agrobacterium vitis]MBE1438231.1 energy-converting hydrogenase Eha subunit G [Agrobacterium vitis]
MNRPVRKARAIAITKAREDHNKIIVRTAAVGLAASLLAYGLMLGGFLG